MTQRERLKELRREARDLKEVVAEQTLELRLLKKSMIPLMVCKQTTAGQRGMGATKNEVFCIREAGDH
jgi:transposase